MAERVWLVTGASRGFGAEISQAVLAAGDKLVATARTMRGLEHLGTHGNLFTAGLDVTDEGDPAKLAHALLELVNAPDPPLRLPLGPDTLTRMAEKNAVIERETST